MRLSRMHRNNKKRSSSRLGAYSQSVTLAPQLVSVPTQRQYWAKLPAFALLVMSIWLLSIMHKNPQFLVSNVIVQGVYLVDPSEVRTVAAVDGTNIFRVQARDVDRRLKDAFGCIDSIQVTCRLPGSVSITVREREAAVIWESGGQNWWIGSDGSILGATGLAGHLPTIRDVQSAVGEPGPYLAGVPWQLAQEMARVLPSVTTYDYIEGLGLVIYVTEARWPVYLGYDGNAEAKVAIMQSLLARLASQGVSVEYIDLRNEHSPIYKKRL